MLSWQWAGWCYGPLLKVTVPEAEHKPPMLTPCAGTLDCVGKSCIQQWRTNAFGGPSSDAPHRLNEWMKVHVLKWGKLHNVLPGSQVTEASSEWPQLWEPQPGKAQSCSRCSLPLQLTLSMSIRLVPCPNCELLHAVIALEKPSCLHTTLASVMSQLSSHTVPHWPS